MIRKIGLGAMLLASLFIVSCKKGGSEESLSPDEKKVALEVVEESFSTAVPVMMKKVSEVVEAEGADKAVAFCNENVAGMGKKMTEELAQKFSEKKVEGFAFGRTTDKVRNPKNTPDESMKKVLEEWQAAEAKGAKAESVVYKKDGMVYALKPIRIPNALCLKCHGTEDTLDAAAMKVLQEKYPEDKALGYKEGDLRGAFWVKFKAN